MHSNYVILGFLCVDYIYAAHIVVQILKEVPYEDRIVHAFHKKADP